MRLHGWLLTLLATLTLGGTEIYGQACQPGFYSNTGSAPCTACSPGTYAPGVGSFFCTPCNVGTYNDTAASSTCQSCTAGRYAGTQGSTACQNCGTGTYSPSSGSVVRARIPPTVPIGNPSMCVSCDAS